MTDVTGNLKAAEAAVDAAREIFVNELGAAPALRKGSGDFATAADLAIEELLRDKLTGATGIGVFGEEQGGKLDEHACWVAVSYTHLTLPTTLHECRSRWSPYH